MAHIFRFHHRIFFPSEEINWLLQPRDELGEEVEFELKGGERFAAGRWAMRVPKGYKFDEANAMFREKMLEVVMLKGIYDQVLNEGQEHEERCLQLLGKQISLYRNENLKHRANGDSPSSFTKDRDFPLKLREMNEKLVNDEGEAQTNA